MIREKSDLLGTVASSVCLVHCLATPLVFIIQAGASNCCDEIPTWWKFIDYILLAISCMAIYWSAKNTSITWIKPLFWFTWSLLFCIILNEKLAILPLPEATIYIPALALVGLHLYNRKYCQCNTTTCCVNEEQ